MAGCDLFLVTGKSAPDIQQQVLPAAQ